MVSLDRLLAVGRQYLFAPEFRIGRIRHAELLDAFTEMAQLLACLDRSRDIERPQKPLEPGPEAQAGEKREQIEVSFVLGLCNDLFRLRRNAGLLAKDGPETKEVRSIKRAMERLDDMLKQRGIEYVDVTGRLWDYRDVDFEPKGQPVPVAGLTHKRIAACECPLVRIEGRIVQRAQGIVEVPA